MMIILLLLLLLLIIIIIIIIIIIMIMIMMKNCSTILTYEGSLDHKKHTSWKELEWWKILAGDPATVGCHYSGP